MSKQSDREDFIVALAREGVPSDVARKVLRHAASLQRYAELACSSEAADNDRVRCPGYYAEGVCLCRDYGAGRIEGQEHAKVPRYMVQEKQKEERITTLLAPFNVKPTFQGDPRGCVVKLKLPSGRGNDFGGEGLWCVP